MTDENTTENATAPASQVERLVMCGRCYAEVTEVFTANCNEKPEKLINAPIGMYHCPDCGAMVVAGVEHPPMCKMCIDRKHPGFDT